ncbi:hypothetical protein ccbrp13_54880 [Ktedonobacteria bacterium brp13]|nr:hypothetical protein ccbrp13_54880 [Ktedonobacteria bacterium brp13]
MNESIKIPSTLILGGAVLGALTGTTAALVSYVRRETIRRGYPAWEECNCDFKTQQTIFQVWHSRLSQRGETIVTQEWGLYLVHLPRWLRRTLHHAAQTIAVLNLRNRYVERVTLTPQQSYQFAAILHASTTNEDLPEPIYADDTFVTWRREILHYPTYLFDACLSRLYPVNVAPEQVHTLEGLPALWDTASNLPLPTEGTLLNTPEGTRIDRIGWSPTQITYCTARVKTSIPV